MNGIDGIAGTLGRAVRRRWPMLLLPALLTAALAAAVVYQQAPLYGAQTQLMLKFGREYTYRPEADGLHGWQPSRMVELVNAEVRILGSRAVRTAVIDKFGLARLHPDLANESLPAAVARERGLDRIDRNLLVRTLSDSTVLVAEFRHEDPELARDVLAAVIEVYRANRAKAFGGTDTAVAEAQLEWADTRLGQARRKVAEFRDANDAWLLESDRAATEANVHRLEVEAREAATTAAQQSELAERFAQELNALHSASARSGPALDLREQPSAAKLQQVLRETSLLAAIAGRDSPALADLRREEAELYGLVRAAYLGGGNSRNGADDDDQRIDRLLSAWHAANRAVPAAEIRARQATEALGPLRDELASLQRTQLELNRLLDEEAQATEGYHQARRLAERASILAILDARGLDNVVVIDAPEASAIPLGLTASARIALGGLLGLALGLACACLLDARVLA